MSTCDSEVKDKKEAIEEWIVALAIRVRILLVVNNYGAPRTFTTE